MSNLLKLTFPALAVIFAVSCGSSTPEGGAGKNDKKAQLQQLKEQQSAIGQQIRDLEADLAKTDTAMAAALNAKLVEVTPVDAGQFTHFIELQGRVDAENIAYVTPRGMGGQVRSVHVKQGERVKKGQLLMKLDDAIVQQQIDQVKVQLELAETLYDRRKNLWEKQIGTEVELLQAKNSVDNLKKQISLLEEQSSMSNVYAEISGVADMVNIKPGEYFSPQSANVLGIRIVNTDNLKIITQVPENYLHRVKEGAVVEISLPDIGKTVKSRVSVKGSTIDPSSRSFYIESKLPASPDFRPNQIAVVKIQDYMVDDAITIPVNTLQNDEKGKYVMVAVKENGRLVAKKRPVEVGELYGSELEVKSGLEAKEALITGGFQGLYDGQPITTGDNI